MDVVIRPARLEETGDLNEVERDGDRRYAGYDGVPAGFDDVVDGGTLEAAGQEGRLWVAVSSAGDADGRESDEGAIVGFALAEVIDGHGHLAQLSVRLDAQGGGVGRLLIEAVCRWADEHSLGTVTLCTFADVDWNRPLYEHLGFVVIPEEQWSPGLRAVFEADRELGLDLSRRVVMGRATK